VVLRGWLRRTCSGSSHYRGKPETTLLFSRGLATLVSRVSFCVESREAIFNMGLDHSKWRLKPQLIWGYLEGYLEGYQGTPQLRPEEE